MNKNPQPDKARFVRIDTDLQDMITRRVRGHCSAVNSVLTFCKEHEIECDFEKAKIYLSHIEKFISDAQTAALIGEENTKQYLRKIIADGVREDIERQFEETETLPDNFNKYIAIDENGYLQPHDATIENDCKVFLQGRALQVREDIEQVSILLRRIFNGTSEKFGNRWPQVLFKTKVFGYNDNMQEFTPRDDIDYSLLGIFDDDYLNVPTDDMDIPDNDLNIDETDI